LIDVVVPEEQEGTKAVVRSWLKKVGDPVAKDDPLVELETDKVTQEVPSPAAGVLSEIVLDTDAEAIPGALLGRIETDGAPAKAGAQSEREARAENGGEEALRATGPRPSPGNREERLSPSVRRACQQHGIDPARIEGTGRNGRITREDVDRAVAAATTVSVGEPATAQSRQFSAQDIPHDRMRLTIAENMARAVAEQPHVTAVFEADFSAVAAHKAGQAAKGVKLSYTAYIVKAAAEAMAVAPAINGRWEKDRIAISPTIDIGVGTALGEKGLVVPVVRTRDRSASNRSAPSSTTSPAARGKGSSSVRTYRAAVSPSPTTESRAHCSPRRSSSIRVRRRSLASASSRNG
jgi:2-oxoglutarate dehydrogenase E2 component (dihydrolipoamide succinyltransferase)